MATDLLLEALANQRKQAESNNLWNLGSQALGSISQSYAANQDPYSDPNDNLIGALIAGLGSGMAKGFGQRQVRQEMADFGNTLRGVAKDYYTNQDLSGYATNENENISSLVMPLTLNRASSQYERSQKLEDERAKRTLDFGFDMRAKGYDVGQDPSGSLTYRANPSFGEAQAEMERPKQLLDIEGFKQKEMFKSDLDRQTKGLTDPKEVMANEDKLRGELYKTGNVPSLDTANELFNSMVRSSTLDTRQAALDMTLATAKITDPDSVVRTSEGEQVINTGGATGYLADLYSYIMGGGNLTTDIKQGLLQIGAQRRDELVKTYNSRLKETAELVKLRGGDIRAVDKYGHFAPSADAMNIYQPQMKPGSDPYVPYDPNMFNKGQAPQAYAPPQAPAPRMGASSRPGPGQALVKINGQQQIVNKADYPGMFK